MQSPIKWVGGKSLLISDIKQLISEITYDRYIEPFCGSLAVCLALEPNNCLLNDINTGLINLYNVIQNFHEEFKLQLKDILKDDFNNQESYNNFKNEFNRIKKEDKPDVLRYASLFIYLNKRGFNGIYRENSKGQYNVPYRQYKTTEYNTSIIDTLNTYFTRNNLKFLNKNYIDILDECIEGDLVYLDPPYYPCNTSAFTSYWKTGFTVENQKELCEKVKEIDRRGVKFIMSNSPCREIEEMYSKFNMRKIHIKRQMRTAEIGKVNKPIDLNEILIWNF